MAILVLSVLLLAMAGGSSGATWCVCRPDVSDSALQKTLDYACGAGADCSSILQNGACFQPNTVKAHCSFAVNSYFQKKGQAQGSCDFSGTATITTTDPGSGGTCSYPSSASAAGTTPSTGTTPPGTSPSTGITPPSTGTTPPGTTPSTGITPPSTGTTPPSTGTGTTPPGTTPSTGTTPPSTSTGTTPPGSTTTTTPPSTFSPNNPTSGILGGGGITSTGLGPTGAGLGTDNSGALLAKAGQSLLSLAALLSIFLARI